MLSMRYSIICRSSCENRIKKSLKELSFQDALCSTNNNIFHSLEKNFQFQEFLCQRIVCIEKQLRTQQKHWYERRFWERNRGRSLRSRALCSTNNNIFHSSEKNFQFQEFLCQRIVCIENKNLKRILFMKGKAVLTLSQRAVKQLQKESKKYIRLDLRKRGCSGLSYTMNYTNLVKENDEVIQQDGINILISPNALMHVIGTRMDYETNRLKSEFVFHNPNSKGGCGCGESFSTK